MSRSSFSTSIPRRNKTHFQVQQLDDKLSRLIWTQMVWQAGVFYKTLGGTWISHPWWIQVYNQCDLNIHCIYFYLYAFDFPYGIRIWHTLWPADLSTDLRMGLSGRTTWPQHWRIVDCTSHLTAVEKVDIFALWVAHRSGNLKSQGLYITERFVWREKNTLWSTELFSGVSKDPWRQWVGLSPLPGFQSPPGLLCF